MHYPLRILIPMALVACNGPAERTHGLPPPTLSLSAAIQVVSTVDSTLALEVAATLRNETDVLIKVSDGPECPLYVRLFWNPTGEPAGSLSSAMACPPGSTTVGLSPGDTTVLTRLLGADTLATFAPGTYGVDVAVTTTTAVIGVWAGAVELPLNGSN